MKKEAEGKNAYFLISRINLKVSSKINAKLPNFILIFR